MQFDYTPEGLMTGLTDANGNPSTFAYADGRLSSVLGPGSSSDSLARTEIPPSADSNGGFEVAHTTADGVETTYQPKRWRTNSNLIAIALDLRQRSATC